LCQKKAAVGGKGKMHLAPKNVPNYIVFQNSRMVGAGNETITSSEHFSDISQLLVSTGFLPSNLVAKDNKSYCEALTKWLETSDTKLVLKELANW